MSFWSEKPEAHKQGWHWIGTAIFLAQMAGLNRNPDVLRLSRKEKGLYKRVWWCCFMRDRLVSLGMSRPMRIRDEDFDVPLPTLEDFEADTLLTSADSTTSPHNPFEHTSLCKKETRTRLAELFIDNVKLCKLIGSILSTQYSDLDRPMRLLRGAADSPSSVMLFPISTSTSDSPSSRRHADLIISLLDSRLTEWHQSLSKSVHLAQSQSPLSSTRGTLQDDFDFTTVPSQPSSLAVQFALLHMSYYNAISALHRPRNRSPPSASKISSSARHIGSICAFLNANSLARYLPVNAIPMLVPSIISHALVIRSRLTTSDLALSGFDEDPETKEARDNFSELLVSLRALRVGYVGADWISMFVDAFLGRVGLKVVTRGPNAYHSVTASEIWRTFEVELQPSPPVSDMNVENVANTGGGSHTAAQNLGIDRVLALTTDSRQTTEHVTSNQPTGVCAERAVFSDVRGGAKTDNEETAWHNLFDFSPFENDGFSELWTTGSINDTERLDGNGEGSFWSSLALDWLA